MIEMNKEDRLLKNQRIKDTLQKTKARRIYSLKLNNIEIQ